MQLLHKLRESGIQLSLHENRIAVTGEMSNEQRRAINRSKPAIQRELRRESVLKRMDEDDQPRRYYVETDDKSHPDFVILALAIRDVGTCELSIPRPRYDGFKLIETLEGWEDRPDHHEHNN